MLCGRATPHVHAGTVTLGGGDDDDDDGSDVVRLRGVESEPRDVGFLSLLEHFKYCTVGVFSGVRGSFSLDDCCDLQVAPCLKTPREPVWVVYSESHYTVLHAEALAGVSRVVVSPEFVLVV